MKAQHFIQGKNAKNENQHIIYDKPNGDLYYAKHGSESKKIQFAEVDEGTRLGAEDFLVV